MIMHKPRGPIRLEVHAHEGHCKLSQLLPRGFSLIELLVVISIIALLLSILVPVLRQVKNQARAVICLSNLRQWGTFFFLYTGDNDGYFPAHHTGGMLTSQLMWVGPLERYYEDEKLRFCPTATIPAFPGGAFFPRGEKFLAWGYFPWVLPGYRDKAGSYGLNSWFNSNPDSFPAWPSLGGNNYKKVDVSGASNIPLFLDCTMPYGRPQAGNAPPAYDGELAPSVPGMGTPMKRFCINRHNQHINGLFLDLSVRKIGLKQLWNLKWHRNYDTGAPAPTDWDDPDHWMYGMRDY